MNHQQLQQLLAQYNNANPTATNAVDSTNSINTSSIGSINPDTVSIQPVVSQPESVAPLDSATNPSLDYTGEVETTSTPQEEELSDTLKYIRNNINSDDYFARNKAKMLLANEVSLRQRNLLDNTHDSLLEEFKQQYSYTDDRGEHWVVEGKAVDNIKQIAREISPYMKKFEGTDYLPISDEDWMNLAVNYDADLNSYGVEEASSKLVNYIQDKVSENQSILEKYGYGFAGMGASCAGALVTTAGMLQGAFGLSDHQDDPTLNFWQNYLDGIIDNSTTRYGNDMITYGAWSEKGIKKAKKYGLSNIEIVQTSGQTNNTDSFFDQIFNVNTLPLALQNQGFSVAATISSFGFSGITNGVILKGAKSLSAGIAAKTAATTAEQIARTKAVLGALNTADKAINMTVIPALVGTVEGVSEALDVKMNLQESGYQKAEERLRQQIDAEISEKIRQRGITLNPETGGSIPVDDSLIKQWYDEAYEKYQTSYLEDLAQANYIAANEAINNFAVNSLVNGALNYTFKAGLMAPRVQKMIHNTKLYKHMASSPFVVNGTTVTAKAPTILDYAWASSKEMTGEFLEEFIQTTSSNAFEKKGSEFYDAWLEAKYDKNQAVNIGSDWAYNWGAFLAGVGDAITDQETWKSGIMGSIGYMLGQPIHNTQNSKAAQRREQGQENWSKARKAWSKYGISWNFGPVSSIRNLQQEYSANKEAAATLTEWLQNPDNMAKFNSITGTISWGQAMDENAQNGDEFGVRNSLLGKTINDVLMLKKLEGTEFHSSIMNELAEIAYVQSGSDKAQQLLTSIRSYIPTDNNQSDDALLETARSNAKRMLETINAIDEASEFIDNTYGILDEDVKQSLLYRQMAVADWNKRYEKLKSETAGISDIQNSIQNNQVTDDVKRIRAKYGSYEKASKAKKEAEDSIQELETQISDLENRQKKGRISKQEKELLSQKKKDLKNYKETLKDFNGFEEYNEESDLLSEQDIMALDPIKRAQILSRGRLKYAQKKVPKMQVNPANPNEKIPMRDSQGNIVYETVRGDRLIKSDKQQEVVENLITQLNMQDNTLYDKLVDMGRIAASRKKYQAEMDAAFTDGTFLSQYAIKAKEEAANYMLSQRADEINKIKDFRKFSRELDVLRASDDTGQMYYRVINKLKKNNNQHLKKYEEQNKELDKIFEKLNKNPKYRALSDNSKNLIGIAFSFMAENQLDLNSADAVVYALTSYDRELVDKDDITSENQNDTSFQIYLNEVNASITEDMDKIRMTDAQELITLIQSLITDVTNDKLQQENNTVPEVTEEEASNAPATADDPQPVEEPRVEEESQPEPTHSEQPKPEDVIPLEVKDSNNELLNLFDEVNFLCDGERTNGTIQALNSDGTVTVLTASNKSFTLEGSRVTKGVNTEVVNQDEAIAHFDSDEVKDAIQNYIENFKSFIADKDLQTLFEDALKDLNSATTLEQLPDAIQHIIEKTIEQNELSVEEKQKLINGTYQALNVKKNFTDNGGNSGEVSALQTSLIDALNSNTNGQTVKEAWQQKNAISTRSNVYANHIDSVPITPAPGQKQSPTIANFLEQNHVADYIRSNSANLASKKIYFARIQSLENALQQEFEQNNLTYTDMVVPIVAVVQDDNGPIKIGEKSYQPIAIMPADNNNIANGSNHMQTIREWSKSKTADNELVKVKGTGIPVETTLYGKVVAVYNPTPASAESSSRHSLLDVIHRTTGKTPEAKEIVKNISNEKNSNGVAEFDYSIDALNGTKTKVRLFIKPVHQTTSVKAGNKTLWELIEEEGRPSTVNKSNYHQLVVNFNPLLSQFLKDINNQIKEISKEIKNLDEAETSIQEILTNASIALNNQLSKSIVIPSEYKYAFTENEGTIYFTARKNEDEYIILSSFPVETEALTNAQLFNIVKNLMCEQDSSGNIGNAADAYKVRLRNPNDSNSNNFMIWQTSWQEVQAKDSENSTQAQAEIATRRVTTLVESDVFTIKEDTLAYTVVGVKLNKPTSLGNNAMPAEPPAQVVSNADNANTNPVPVQDIVEESFTSQEETTSVFDANATDKFNKAQQIKERLREVSAALNRARFNEEGEVKDRSKSKEVWVTELIQGEEEYEAYTGLNNSLLNPALPIGNTVDKYVKAILRNTPLRFKDSVTKKWSDDYVLDINSSGQYVFRNTKTDETYSLTDSRLHEQIRIPNFSEEGAQELIKRAFQIKNVLEQRGEEVVDFSAAIQGKMQVFDSGNNEYTADVIAGPDIMTIDKNGTYHIYDIKSANNSHNFTKQENLTKWKLQTSIYCKLLRETYGATVSNKIEIIQMPVYYNFEQQNLSQNTQSNQIIITQELYGQMTNDEYHEATMSADANTVPLFSTSITEKEKLILKFEKLPEDVQQKIVNQSPNPAQVETPQSAVIPTQQAEENNPITGLPEISGLEIPLAPDIKPAYGVQTPTFTNTETTWDNLSKITHEGKKLNLDEFKDILADPSIGLDGLHYTLAEIDENQSLSQQEKENLKNQAFSKAWDSLSQAEKCQKLQCVGIWS